MRDTPESFIYGYMCNIFLFQLIDFFVVFGALICSSPGIRSSPMNAWTGPEVTTTKAVIILRMETTGDFAASNTYK